MKNTQFSTYQADILPIIHTHGIVILTKFSNNQTKIVDFLLIAYFSSSSIFFSPVFICSKVNFKNEPIKFDKHYIQSEYLFQSPKNHRILILTNFERAKFKPFLLDSVSTSLQIYSHTHTQQIMIQATFMISIFCMTYLLPQRYRSLKYIQARYSWINHSTQMYYTTYIHYTGHSDLKLSKVDGCRSETVHF